MQEERYISKNSCYDNFLNVLKTEATRVVYVHNLRKLLAFSKLRDYESLMSIPDQDKFNLVRDYLDHRRNKEKVSYSTINTSLAAIKLFYEVNDVTLPWKHLAKHKGESGKIIHDRLYTDEEISKMLEHADLRMRVVILALLTTGMRVGSLATLKMGDVEYIPDYHIYKFKVYSDTLRHSYITFCTPECAIEIDKYTEYRKEEGERITKDTPFIKGKSNGLFPGHTEQLSSNVLQKAVRRLQHKAKITEPVKLGMPTGGSRFRHEVMNCHAFRKIFNTKCIDNDVKFQAKEMFMGHKSNLGLDNSYWHPTEANLLQEYAKVIDSLTINEENKLKTENALLKRDKERTDKMMIEILEKFEKWETDQRNMK